MAYTKTAWQDSPSTATPINATNLNHIEQGIYDAHSGISTLDNNKASKTEVSQLNEDLTISSTSTSTTITDSADGYIRDFSAYGKSEQTQLSGTNICGYQNMQYKVNLSNSDKITITNKTDKLIILYMYTNYGDTSHNDYWNVNSGETRTIAVAYETKAISYGEDVSQYAGFLWGNYGETLLPYEPYCGGIPSPNPSYPQEIKAWDGDVETHTKNLLKCTLQTTTQNGVTCTKNADGSYTLNGTASAVAVFAIADNPIFDGTCKFTCCPSGGSGSTYSVQYSNYVNMAYEEFGDGVIVNQFDYSVYPNTHININIGAGYTCNNLTFKPMICTDTTATYSDYVPYHSTLASLGINLYGIKVSSGGNYTDADGQQWIADKLDLKKGVIERWCGVKSVSQTTGGSSGGGLGWTDVTIASGNSEFMCEGYQINKSSDSAWVSTTPCAVYVNNTTIRIYDTTGTTVSTNILYVLATPTTESLTDAQISALKGLQTYSDGTYIEYGTLQPFASIDYFTSTENGKAVAEVDSKASEQINIANEKLSNLVFEGSCVKTIFGFDSSNSTLYMRYYTSESDYYQLFWNDNFIKYGKFVNGQWSEMWSK